MKLLKISVKGAQSRLNGLKSLAKLSILLFFNPCQSSPSLTILVPLCFLIISLVFFYLCKVLFSGFLQFNSNFVDAQNNSKYRDCAPLMWQCLCCCTCIVLTLGGSISKLCIKPWWYFSVPSFIWKSPNSICMWCCLFSYKNYIFWQNKNYFVLPKYLMWREMLLLKMLLLEY